MTTPTPTDGWPVASASSTTVKPGIKTTELWLTVLVEIGILATSIASYLPPKWASIDAAVAAGAYALSRGNAKSGA
jgi:hypothetical protein